MIPKMLMFNLDISCFTTSNLPWFINLTFQLPVQYCSLQHWTLLSSPDTSTTKRWPSCFILSGAISNCPLLFPSSLLGTFWPGRLIFGVISFAFSYCSWVSLGKNTGVACHFLLHWTTFFQNCSLCPSILGDSWHGSDLHWIMQALCHNKAVIHEWVLDTQHKRYNQ